MLVLSRQRDQSIIIGDNIIITIVDIRGDKVRLGIDAPKEIPVHRQEVYEAIQRENLRNGDIEGNLEIKADTLPEGSGGNSGTAAKQYSMIPRAMIANGNYDTIDIGRFGTHYSPMIR